MANSEKDDFSFKNYFIPLTNSKVVTWIILIGVLVFFNMFFNAFVWDDRTFIQYNPDMLHLNLFYLLGPNMFNNISAGQYRAFIAIYFTFFHTFFGNNAFFYHIAQLTIHITNTILIFYFLKKFFRVPISFFLSLLFLIHPMQVESVSYIASSDNPLFTLFGLIALILSTKEELSYKQTILIFLLLILSIMSKETGIFFTFLVVIYRFLFLKKEKIIFLTSGIIVILAYFFLRFFIAGVYFSKVLLAPISRLSFTERLLNIPSILLYYIKTLLFPVNLAIIQYWTVTKINFSNFYLPLFIDIFLILLLLILGFFVYKKQKQMFGLLIFFVVWIILGFGIYSQIFALNMTVADRWFYFPFIGILGILGIVLNIFKDFITKHKKIFITFTIIILFLFSIRTVIRNSNWQNPIMLYTHDIKVMDNFELENTLGGELNSAGDRSEAFIHFKKSVKLFPHVTNLFNLGLSYEQKSDYKNAEKYYQKAFNSDTLGSVPYPHKKLEIIYVRYSLVTLQTDPKSALGIINEGLKDYPNDATMWYVKAECEYKLNNYNQALDAAEKAYQIVPNDSNAANLYNRILNKLPIDTSIK
ncbi:MAG TPA: tetratricopeptide repeat protein [Patescibacteria group bacterium]